MMPDRRGYLREYQRQWMARRRQDWLALNGPCRACGTWEDLEVDHIDPDVKLYHISDVWSRRAEVREAELAKCQVLCQPCHLAKTSQWWRDRFPGEHGTMTMYKRRGCKCAECRSANASYELKRRVDLAGIGPATSAMPRRRSTK